MLSRLHRFRSFSTVFNFTRCSSTDIVKQKPVEILIKEEKLPIEKTSLSRGLALNKFEKDFLIYPEFSETEDVEAIKRYVNKVESDLETALVDAKDAKELDSNVLATLLKNGVFHSFIPKEYGGAGFCHKDLLCLNEALGIDLSTYVLVNQSYIASRLILIHGTPEQKEKYLPKLASFQLKPAICIADLPTGERTEVLAHSGVEKKLNGWKTDVINGDIADIFIVFAADVKKTGGDGPTTCYIIDKSELGAGTVTVAEQKHTQGLNAIHLTKINFSNIVVSEKNTLGGHGFGQEALNEVLSYGNFYAGSATVGFLKRLLKELVKQANTSIEGNRRLAENVAVQRALSDTGLNLFVLESIVYYIGGLLDEGLILTTDIENAIIQKFINRILKEAFSTITEVVGSSATDHDAEYDKMVRDMNTLISLNLSDTSLAKTISLSMIVSWVEATNYESKYMKAQGLKRFFNAQKFQDLWNNPKLKHFIAEHVHPSLEPACRKLENTMTRLDMVLNRIVEDAGSRIREEMATLESLSKILENNLAMIATISRASRSYSIGLKNSDIELAWAISFCHSASRQSQQELEFIMDHYGLIKKNPTLVNIGAAVVDFGGYPLERPIERNW